MTQWWWRHWNDVITIFLKFDFVIISLKNHNLAKYGTLCHQYWTLRGAGSGELLALGNFRKYTTKIVHFRHVLAKILPKNLKQHFDWGAQSRKRVEQFWWICPNVQNKIFQINNGVLFFKKKGVFTKIYPFFLIGLVQSLKKKSSPKFSAQIISNLLEFISSGWQGGSLTRRPKRSHRCFLVEVPWQINMYRYLNIKKKKTVAAVCR